MKTPKYQGMFAIDQRVVTTEDAGSEDWRSGSRKNCRWGVAGVIRDASTGHGWCYLVEHEDGSKQWYDHEELREPGPKPSGDDAREGATTSVVPGVVADGEAQQEPTMYEQIEYAGETYRVSLTITGRISLARRQWRSLVNLLERDEKLVLQPERSGYWTKEFLEEFLPWAQQRYELADDRSAFVVNQPSHVAGRPSYGRLRFSFWGPNSEDDAREYGLIAGSGICVDYESWQDVGVVGVLHEDESGCRRIEDTTLVYNLRNKVLDAAIRLAQTDCVFSEPQDPSFGGFQ